MKIKWLKTNIPIINNCNNFCKKYSTNEMVEDFKNTINKYFIEYGNYNMSRDYFVANSKTKGRYKTVFKTFGELKKAAEFNLEIQTKNIISENEKRGKKYIISSIVAGSKVNKNFLNALLRFCMFNKAQLILAPIKGVNKETTFDREIIENFGKYFATDYTFNSNLKLVNIFATANTNNPLHRIKEFCNKKNSIILGSCKQRMEIIPSLKKDKTHIAYTTGTVSEPEFKQNINGILNDESKKTGALVVEIIDDKFFNIRNVEWIDDSFVDLNRRYFYDRIEKTQAEAIVAGDLHISGDEDNIALGALKEQIKFLGAKKIIVHDIASHNSINHHEKNNLVCSSLNVISLEEEHKYISNWLNNWVKDLKDVEIISVESNHNEWLKQYLSDRNTWIYDRMNTHYANSLFGELLDKKDPLEIAIRKNLDLNVKIKFLKRTDTYKIGGYELSMHGDKCSGIGKATLKQLKNSVGNLVCGHSHSPKIYDGSYQVGTNTKIPLNYAEGTANNWIHANCSIYNTGHAQMLMSFNGKWRLKNI